MRYFSYNPNTLTNSRYRILYENFYIETLTRYKPYTDVLVFDELIYIYPKNTEFHMMSRLSL